MIESKRVKIYPANKEQMENQIVAEKDPELKKGLDIFCIERKSKQPLTQIFLAHIKMHTRTIIFTCNYIIYFFYTIPF